MMTQERPGAIEKTRRNTVWTPSVADAKAR
jgi:hypothetical protein